MPILEQLGMQAATGAVGAGMGMLLGGMQDKRQYKQAEKMQKLQIQGSKELTDYNTAKQLQMWKDTSYGAQKEQMEKAGINPALMYGMGGGGGQSNSIAQGSVSSGGGPSTGGEVQGMMGMAMQMALLKAQKENIEASTNKTKAETQNLPLTGKYTEALTGLTATTNELSKLNLQVDQNTLWERINGIVAEQVSKEENAITAGVNKEIAMATIDDKIKQIKAEAINTGLQGAAIKAGISLTEEQTRKIGQDIVQRWAEINISGTKNEYEHADRLKAIQEYTENALKVAGIVAVGNIVRDVAGIVTRKVPKGHTTETYRDGKGTTITDTQYR